MPIEPLLIALDPTCPEFRPRPLEWLARGARQWIWKTLNWRTRPPLVLFTGDVKAAQVLVRFVNEIPGGSTLLGSVSGSWENPGGIWKVDLPVTLLLKDLSDRNDGAAPAIWAAAHEIGHALGLVHGPRGIMYRSFGNPLSAAGLPSVSRDDRVEAVSFRRRGIVAVSPDRATAAEQRPA